jgi:ABC-type Fe3+/spermidine/putrescine transport system ATPase subunit
MLPHENGIAPGSPAVLMARPEAFRVTTVSENRLSGTVTARRLVGGSALFTVTLPGGETLEVSAEPKAIKVGDEVGLEPAGRGLHLFPQDRP